MADEKKPEALKMIAENRRAHMRYSFDETLEVGVALLGSEVKSLRLGKLELVDAYAQMVNGELWLMNAYIAPYKFATHYGHEPKRVRRLLAHRHEIDKLDAKVSQKGFTLIPLKAYFKNGKAKFLLGLGKGKQVHDRREEIKEREGEREARAAMKRGRER